MDTFLHFFRSFLSCRTPRHVLAFLWLAGLVSGVFFSLLTTPALFSLIRLVPNSVLTFSGLLVSQVLPLLLTATFARASKPVFLLTVVYLKGYFFSFISFTLMCALGVSGWLVRSLVMFSDLLIMPILWWLWLRIFDDNRCADARGIILVIAVVFLVCFFDSAVVAPFLVNLI